MAGLSVVSGPQMKHCVFTITLLVAFRQSLSSAAGEQEVGLSRYLVCNTWGTSIRVFESWFNQHFESHQVTNVEHWHSFKQSVARFLIVQVDMFNVYKCHTISSSVSFVGTNVYKNDG